MLLPQGLDEIGQAGLFPGPDMGLDGVVEVGVGVVLEVADAFTVLVEKDPGGHGLMLVEDGDRDILLHSLEADLLAIRGFRVFLPVQLDMDQTLVEGILFRGGLRLRFTCLCSPPLCQPRPVPASRAGPRSWHPR